MKRNLREKVLAGLTDKMEPDNPETVNAMINLAISYCYFARFKEALEMQEKAVALTTAKSGQNHALSLAIRLIGSLGVRLRNQVADNFPLSI